jgi:uncharacterized protein (DUF302 family)
MKKLFFIALFIVAGASTAFLVNSYADNAEKKSKSKVPEFASVYSTEGVFADAKEDLLSSIAGNGLVVSYTSHAKDMFERTAEVTGTTTPVYDEAEIVLFCKVDLSHDLVAANPHNIVLCPYAIAIYVLHKEPEKVYLSFREPDARVPETKAIKALLVSIIEEII